MIDRSKIPGGFGAIDQIFAAHPLDEGRAFDLLNELRKAGTSSAEVEAAVKDLLQAKNCGPDHIREQVRAVKRHFGPWLASGTP